jgi:hypothetical protein
MGIGLGELTLLLFVLGMGIYLFVKRGTKNAKQ